MNNKIGNKFVVPAILTDQLDEAVSNVVSPEAKILSMLESIDQDRESTLSIESAKNQMQKLKDQIKTMSAADATATLTESQQQDVQALIDKAQEILDNIKEKDDDEEEKLQEAQAVMAVAQQQLDNPVATPLQPEDTLTQNTSDPNNIQTHPSDLETPPLTQSVQQIVDIVNQSQLSQEEKDKIIAAAQQGQVISQNQQQQEQPSVYQSQSDYDNQKSVYQNTQQPIDAVKQTPGIVSQSVQAALNVIQQLPPGDLEQVIKQVTGKSQNQTPYQFDPAKAEVATGTNPAPMSESVAECAECGAILEVSDVDGAAQLCVICGTPLTNPNSVGINSTLVASEPENSADTQATKFESILVNYLNLVESGQYIAAKSMLESYGVQAVFKPVKDKKGSSMVMLESVENRAKVSRLYQYNPVTRGTSGNFNVLHSSNSSSVNEANNSASSIINEALAFDRNKLVKSIQNILGVPSNSINIDILDADGASVIVILNNKSAVDKYTSDGELKNTIVTGIYDKFNKEGMNLDTYDVAVDEPDEAYLYFDVSPLKVNESLGVKLKPSDNRKLYNDVYKALNDAAGRRIIPTGGPYLNIIYRDGYNPELLIKCEKLSTTEEKPEMERVVNKAMATLGYKIKEIIYLKNKGYLGIVVFDSGRYEYLAESVESISSVAQNIKFLLESQGIIVPLDTIEIAVNEAVSTSTIYLNPDKALSTLETNLNSKGIEITSSKIEQLDSSGTLLATLQLRETSFDVYMGDIAAEVQSLCQNYGVGVSEPVAALDDPSLVTVEFKFVPGFTITEALKGGYSPIITQSIETLPEPASDISQEDGENATEGEFDPAKLQANVNEGVQSWSRKKASTMIEGVNPDTAANLLESFVGGVNNIRCKIDPAHIKPGNVIFDADEGTVYQAMSESVSNANGYAVAINVLNASKSEYKDIPAGTVAVLGAQGNYYLLKNDPHTISL